MSKAMTHVEIPNLSEREIQEGLSQAKMSPRRRHPRILHNPGDEFNMVINFMLADSYMQPHLHPGWEKIEKIYILQGKIAVLFFDDDGHVTSCTTLEKGATEKIEVPAFKWHTYVILSNFAITYETMMGKYEPTTWKEFAERLPKEDSPESLAYLTELKRIALKMK
jgi:cupin fold WbuC family metalloprotein